ncbi:Protease Do-like 9 [Micractinium conductrix]|uniref:Protease Do-like 9 n=1 Tax=Micractinium conductrix TaxID=554055 RepID=A0A2P6V3H0_9CHLO|nr:Protease Do-like 9 [Micractinium conductrix]|eukprot:PSC68632.1 Protease Do-like 9 [Micractinium conductrix]
MQGNCKYYLQQQQRQQQQQQQQQQTLVEREQQRRMERAQQQGAQRAARREARAFEAARPGEQRGWVAAYVHTRLAASVWRRRPADGVLWIDVGNDGTVPFRHGERVDFKWVVTQKHVHHPYLVQRYGSLGAAPVRLMSCTYYGVVVPSSVLACDTTLGCESTLGVRDGVVQRFNGQPIHSLAQLARLVEDSREQYFRFDLEAASKV